MVSGTYNRYGFFLAWSNASGAASLIANRESNVGLTDDVLLMESGIPSQFGTLEQIFTVRP